MIEFWKIRGRVIDRPKSAHGHPAAHGRSFRPATFGGKLLPMGGPAQRQSRAAPHHGADIYMLFLPSSASPTSLLLPWTLPLMLLPRLNCNHAPFCVVAAIPTVNTLFFGIEFDGTTTVDRRPPGRSKCCGESCDTDADNSHYCIICNTNVCGICVLANYDGSEPEPMKVNVICDKHVTYCTALPINYQCDNCKFLQLGAPPRTARRDGRRVTTFLVN